MSSCRCEAMRGTQPMSEACGGCCGCIEAQIFYSIEKLEQQLKEANEVIFNIGNKSVGKEYGLDAEELWELSKGYINKYKVKE